MLSLMVTGTPSSSPSGEALRHLAVLASAASRGAPCIKRYDGVAVGVDFVQSGQNRVEPIDGRDTALPIRASQF